LSKLQPSASTGTQAADFRSRTSQYSRMGTKQHPTAPAQSTSEVIKDKSKTTLAQVLSHIFEKAINVQYAEF